MWAWWKLTIFVNHLSRVRPQVTHLWRHDLAPSVLYQLDEQSYGLLSRRRIRCACRWRSGCCRRPVARVRVGT